MLKCDGIQDRILRNFFGKGRNIILVHGIKNKGTGIPNKDMVIAEKRKADWEARNCI
jgi:hypothetical protein